MGSLTAFLGIGRLVPRFGGLGLLVRWGAYNGFVYGSLRDTKRARAVLGH